MAWENTREIGAYVATLRAPNAGVWRSTRGAVVSTVKDNATDRTCPMPSFPLRENVYEPSARPSYDADVSDRQGDQSTSEGSSRYEYSTVPPSSAPCQKNEAFR